MFALTAASMGFAIYGPPILQELRGFSPLWAGYAVGAESMAWTLAALAVAGATGGMIAFALPERGRGWSWGSSARGAIRFRR